MPDAYKTTYHLLNVIQILGFLGLAATLIGAFLMRNHVPGFELLMVSIPSVILALLLMAAGQVGAAVLNMSRDIRALREANAESRM